MALYPFVQFQHLNCTHWAAILVTDRMTDRNTDRLPYAFAAHAHLGIKMLQVSAPTDSYACTDAQRWNSSVGWLLTWHQALFVASLMNWWPGNASRVCIWYCKPPINSTDHWSMGTLTVCVCVLSVCVCVCEQLELELRSISGSLC